MKPRARRNGTPRIALTIFACVLSLSIGIAYAGSVRVGFVATFSGPERIVGQHSYDGFMLGVEHVGGQLGNITTEVVKEDDQLNPGIGLRIARKLLRDRVDFVVAAASSSVMLAMYQRVVDANVFLIGANSGPSPIAGLECSPWFFSSAGQDDGPHEAMGKHVQQLGYKRLYVIAQRSRAGRDGVEAFMRSYQREVVGEVYTHIDAPNYPAVLGEMGHHQPDALHVFLPGGMGVDFVRQYAQARLKRRLPLFSAFTIEETTLKTLGDSVVGVFATASWDSGLDNPVSRHFVADFQRRYAYAPSRFAAQAYDAALLIDNGLRAVNGKVADKEGLRAAFRRPTFQSVHGGTIRYNTNHFPFRNVYLYRVVKDASGQARLENRTLLLEDHGDVHAKECPMRW